MNTSAALRLARTLMNQHGLQGWSVGLDRAKARAGACHFGKRRITLSGPLTRAHDEDLVRDTILHEIAHALVGPAHGHDRVWKAKAREIGAPDSRCFESQAARDLAAFVGVCAQGHEVRRHRRPTRVVTCAQCSPKFNLDHVFEWTRHGRRFTHHDSYQRELQRSGRTPSTGAGSMGTASTAASEFLGPLLTLGESARITAIGKYQGRVGEVEGVGRSRYQVRIGDGILSVPFELVEPA